MRFFLCLAPWALLLALSACTKNNDSGAPDAAEPPDAAPDVSPCVACENTATAPGGQCYAQAAACNASTACTALATCISECSVNDESCVTTCGNASPASVPAYDAVGDCLCGSTSCPSICGASCAGQYDAGPFDSGMGITDSGLVGDTGPSGTDAGGACTACENTATNGTCAPEVTACTQSSSCMALLTCLNGCQAGDTSCEAACESTDMAGVSDFNAAVQCIDTQCSSACGG
jgi:hypothetical protein